MTTMISTAKARDYHRRLEAYETAREAFDPKRYARGGGYTPSEVKAIETMAGVKNTTNEERAELELYLFMTEKPDHLFAYYDRLKNSVTGFMGQKLGDIVGWGKPYKARAATLCSIRVHGLNGCHYAGTANMSHGTYCKLRKVTSTRRR